MRSACRASPHLIYAHPSKSSIRKSWGEKDMHGSGSTTYILQAVKQASSIGTAFGLLDVWCEASRPLSGQTKEDRARLVSFS